MSECQNSIIHFNAQEFVAFKKKIPEGFSFVEVDGEGLQKAQEENHDPKRLYFNRYSPDIFTDGCQDLVRLFVVSCPFLANNLCQAKSFRPQACRRS